MFGDSGFRLASIVVGILFILGLIVIANRFGSQIRQTFQTTKVADATITPSPALIDNSESAQIDTQTENTAEVKGGLTYAPNTTKVPDTGAEVLIIPSLFSLFGMGLKLRKTS